MKPFICILCLLFSIRISVSAQPTLQWAKNYNDSTNGVDKAYIIATDNNGNVFVTGQADGLGTGANYLTMKYDAFGNLVWKQTFDGAAHLDDIPTAMKVDPSGNVYVTGKSQGSATGFDYATVKYNAAGVLQSGFPVLFNNTNAGGNGDDIPTDIALSLDYSKVFVTGYSHNYTSSTSGSDCMTIGYNSSGAQLWLRDFDTNGTQDTAFKITVHTTNEIYVLCNTFSGNYPKILKYSATGTYINYSSACGSGSSIEPVAQLIDGANNQFLLSYNLFPTSNIFIAKNDQNTFNVWCKYYDGIGAGNDVPTDMVMDPSGNFYVSGYTDIDPQNNIDYAGLVIKYNSAGDTVWTRRFSGAFTNGDDRALKLALDNTSNHNVIVTGYETNANGNKDMVVLKLDNSSGGSGAVLWKLTYDQGCNNEDRVMALKADNWNNIYLTGYSYCSATGEDFTTVKYCASVSPVPAISWASGQLHSTAAAGNQWYLNGTLISGATLQDFTPAQNGTYKTCLYNGCTCSDSLTITNVGIGEWNPEPSVSVFPNPSMGQVWVKSPDLIEEMVVTDLCGSVVLRAKPDNKDYQLHLDNNGVYFITILFGHQTTTRK